MPTPKLTDEEILKTIKVYRESGFNVSATARHFDKTTRFVRYHLQVAKERGLLPDEVSIHKPNERSIGLQVVEAQKKAFAKKKRKGSWRKPRRVDLDYDGPYCLIAFGDQHFDDDGTDLELYEYWESHLDAGNRVYGVHVGDFLNNWLRFLGFLWGQQDAGPEAGWALFKHYLERFAPHSIAAVLGNHDLWNEASHFFKELFEPYPMYCAPDAIRLSIKQPNSKPVLVSIRHRWKGHSQWNYAHGVMKAARMGYRDDILIGGDYHVSGSSKVVCPDTKRVSHCHQIASFKVLDRYADEKGFEDAHITPAVALVIRPWLDQSDPRRVVAFDDPADARAFLDLERDRWEARNDKAA